MVSRFTAEEVSKLVQMKDISEEEIQSYYDRNRAEFGRPAQNRAAHIQVADEERARTLLSEIKSAIDADPARARKIFGGFSSVDTHTKARLGFLERRFVSEKAARGTTCSKCYSDSRIPTRVGG